MKLIFPLLIITCIIVSCHEQSAPAQVKQADSTLTPGTYGYDAAFLKKHLADVVELSDTNSHARVLLSAACQGRVLTSAAGNDSSNSYGWINYKLIESGQQKAQFNPIGGEERFWMGPEGGQYALYFKKGDSFNIAHWQVPPVIDTEKYNVVESDPHHVIFSKDASLANYAGTPFNIGITRKITLLNQPALQEKLGTDIPSSLKYVAYETSSSIKNTGNEDWKKDKGLPSVWLLSMMTPSDETVVIIPFSPIKNARNYITDNYFGQVPADRLIVKDSILFFKCDGKHRSKIGLSPVIAKPIAGSYDFKRNILTVILFAVDKNGDYVNSKWELQKEPYKGDVVNSYNDGPLQDGSQLGPFYEVESSSHVKELKKGESLSHTETICHFEGNYQSLNTLAVKLLGIQLDAVKMQ
jgi:hypothetical protein